MDGTLLQNSEAFGQPVARLTRLDGLRGLAACGVAFLYHPQSLFSGEGYAELPRVLQWFQHWGWTLVDLFFLISGYIFAHVYLQGAEEGRGLRRETLGEFAIARIARLYPLHLLTLVACALLFASDPANTVFAFIGHLLMLQAFVEPVAHTFNGPSWSISVEVVCYVLFALGAVGGKRTLKWVTVFAICAALLHFVVQGRPEGPWVGDGLPRGLLGFFLGQAMWMHRDRLANASTALVLCFILFGLALDTGRMSSVLPLSLYAWPGLLVLALRMPWMGGRPMRWLGDRSYAIYLIHAPVLMLLEKYLPELPGDVATISLVTVAFAATVLVLSDLSYRFVETPGRKAIRAAWKRRGARSEGKGVQPA